MRERIRGRGGGRGGDDPCRAQPLALELGQCVDRSHSPAHTDFGLGAVCSGGAGRRRRISANERDPVAPAAPEQSVPGTLPSPWPSGAGA